MPLLTDVLTALDAGRAVALVTVVDVGGSCPRHLGARMAVTADGACFDTIGGGRVELEVTTAARAVASGAAAHRIRHHLVRDLAMCCGGWMEFSIAPAARDRDVIAAAVAAIAARQPQILITAIDDGRLALATPGPDDGRAPRRADATLRELVAAPDRAIVFGAGHVGRALAPMVAALGFEVIVCDDDDTGGLATPVAGASRTVESFAVTDIERAIGALGAGDHAFVVTRDHALDERLMFELFARPLTYLGMIGSRGKVGRFQKRLAARGVDPARWATVRAPIGLALGAETPAEIAIAIAAELVALRHGDDRHRAAWERPA